MEKKSTAGISDTQIDDIGKTVSFVVVFDLNPVGPVVIWDGRPDSVVAAAGLGRGPNPDKVLLDFPEDISTSRKKEILFLLPSKSV